MPYDIYGNPLRRGYCEVHPNVREKYPCSECFYEMHNVEQGPEPPQQEPDDVDICGMQGHPYYGEDENGGRCYCGEKRYPSKVALQEGKE